MSIDAIINKVTEDGSNLILDLMSREIGGLRGQPRFIIKNFTHTPTVGQQIWGGAGECVIEPGQGVKGQRWYRRNGYTELRERFCNSTPRADICFYCGLEYHPMCVFILEARLNPDNKPRQIWACEYTFTFDLDGNIKNMEHGSLCFDKAIRDGYKARRDLTPSR